ncbi:MAG: hypothetical protein EPO68_14690 [Planctomycetota bacterium]|nr:MAG: hypothetical protein EPO68_14690 [Planctomycetota bacterium]
MPRRRSFLVFAGSAAAFAACRKQATDDPLAGITACSRTSKPGISAFELNAFREQWPSSATLFDAWKLAREHKRTLLVVLGRPKPLSFPTEHERAFGTLIEHGADEHVAVLHAFELAFASGADVERVFRVACSSEAMFAVVEDAPDGPRVRSALPSLPAMPHPNPAPNDVAFDLAVWEPEFVSAERAQHAALIAALRELQSTDVLAAELAPFAADGAKRAERLAGLADEVRERWAKTPPAGARWGRDNGCGGDIEGGYSSMDCGMGYVPEPSRRFLIYYEGG